MSTRQRQTGKTTAEKEPHHLPPKREGKATQDVRPPLSGFSLSTVIYVLAGLGFLWAALSAYRVTQLKADAGGWYNLALGRRPDTGEPLKGNPSFKGSSRQTTPNTGVKGIEERIRALADELGIHPRELASAIRPLLPPATATSISAEASATPMADAVIGVLADDAKTGAPGAASAAASFGGLAGVVGLDDPTPDLEGV